MKNKTSYQYPWRYRNKFEVLVDGSRYFSAMLEEIRQAQHFILFETYLIESGKIAEQFITALREAATRQVKVYVLFDEYGSQKLDTEDKQKLVSAGIELLLYNPVSIFRFSQSLKRDHRKLLVIDNETAFIGGAGFSDEFTPAVSENYWHDVMLRIQGNIVPDCTHSFISVWEKYKPAITVPKPQQQKRDIENHGRARLLLSSGAEQNEIIRSVINNIRASNKRIWLTSPYFISSWKIRRALRHAAKRGVDVRLVFPGPHSDHKWITYGIQRYYRRLLRANIAIYEFQPRFTHAKIILCDDWYTIGSSNIDRWNQFLNLDTNIEIYDQDTCRDIIDLFKSNFSKSTLVILNAWSSRSLLQHVKEWGSGIIIYILGIILRKFKD